MKNYFNLNQLSMNWKEKRKTGDNSMKPADDQQMTSRRPAENPVQFFRYVAMLLMLLTLGVGQMWAWDAMVCRSTAGGLKATKTVGDKLNGGTEWNYTFTTNGGWSSGELKVLVGISTSHYKSVDGAWVSDDGSTNKNVKGNIGNVQFDKSGYWYAVGKYKTAYTTTNSSWTSNTTLSFGTNSEPYWKVNPPAVKSGTISISATNTATGSGTGLSAESPIILTSGSASRLTISATQNVSDANSSLYCKFGSGSYSSTVTYDIAANTLTSNQTLALAVKYYNSSASLSGTESTATIYYKWEEAPAVVLTASKTSGINVGEAITLTATGSYASNITQYEFYEGSTKIATVSAPTNTYSYTPTTVGGKTMKVVMTYNSGSSTVTSANLALTLNTPSVSLAVKAGSSSAFHLGEGSTILVATKNNVGSGVTPSYVFTDQLGETSASQTGTEWTYNPSTTGQAKSRTMKVTMSVGGGTYTGTVSVTVYEKFTIHIKNTDSWSAMYLYMWDGGTYNKAWPGVQQTAYNSSSKWYNVVLDTRYTSFIISQGNDTKKSGTISMLAASNAGNCYTTTTGTSLPSATCPSAPSVTTAAASSVGTTSVKFNASSVSANHDDITEYGFKWGTTSACSSGTVTASNLGTGTTFSTTKSSLTNGTTYYFKAYATNGQGTTYGDPVSVRTKFVTTVTLDMQGGSNGTSSVDATEGSAMPSGKVAPEKTGHTFGGYYKNEGGSGKQYYSSTMTSVNNWDVAASTATIYAKWTPTTYTITYKDQGNVAFSGSHVDSPSAHPTSHTYGTATSLNGATKTGYTFGGWYTNSTCTEGPVTSLGATAYTANITLYAKWTANNYTVKFDATTNGGSCATASKSVTFGSAYGELPVATHAANTFIGWYTTASGEGTHVTSSTTVSTASDHILYARFESTYTVNVQFKCGSVTLYPGTTVQASPTSLAADISAPEVLGYSFVNWTGSNATFGNPSSATTTVNATAATTITANYNAVPTVYFKNNLGWENVYVSFNIDFVTAAGATVPKNNGKPYYKMTQLGTSDIFYCEIPSTYTASDYAGWKGNIAFDNKGFGDYSSTHTGNSDSFYKGEFLGRADFDPNATLYIPYKGDKETRNSGKYYPTGCWIQYNSNYSGYKVKVNTKVQGTGGTETVAELRTTIAGSTEFKGTVNLTSANYTYGVMLYKEYLKNSNDLWYTNVNNEANTITSATTSLPWAFQPCTDSWQRCRVKTEALGDYEITVSFATGKPMVNITYPVSVGDWRLVYKDRATWSNGAHSASWWHPSRVIKAKANAVDTVSFFVAYGSTPSVELQKCTAIDGGTGAQTWTKQGDYLSLSSITKKGVYNFKVTQTGSKVASAAYLGEYSGDFYIRTDASDGGWNNYMNGANTMTYSEYSIEHGGYTHYFMNYRHSGTSVKFVIANDYSPCISDTILGDTYTGNSEWLPAAANIRFMWDKRSNTISRAYLSGSTIVSDRFLVLEGDAKMFDENGNPLSISGLSANEMKFTDDQNWIYEATVKAQPTARIKLTAKYNNKIQYFYGKSGARSESTTELLIGGSGTDKYKVRVVYDFKTNRLIKAFIPEGTISTAMAINADLMIIREAQGDAQQINFSGDGTLSKVQTVYGAMKFNKWNVNDKDKGSGHANLGWSRYKRDLFYISFPFDVKLSDAFGFGEYGKHWIIEYYDGKGRAANGFWADSDPNWKFVWPSQRSSFTLKAFEGYILALELDEMTESSEVWEHGVEDVYVYFPSADSVKNISATTRTITIDQEGYYCSINRPTPDGDRRVKDSYWHVIGVPSFANYSSTLYDTNGGTAIDWTSTSMPYLYEWNSSDNTLSITTSANFAFKPTYSYMVQYAGASIYWNAVNVTPAAAPRRNPAYRGEYEFRLEMLQNDEKVDQTYVKLSDDENVTTGFEFNYDLSKEFNKKKANIYTLIGTEQVAGNVLPLTEQTTIVPIGVKTVASGDYTFAMPDGTEGIGVTLIDNETGLRTPLGLTDYTVTLEAGTYDERFALEISPVKQTPTDIELLNGENGENGVRKVMIDGILYIVKDGKVFDARGSRVK